MKRMRGTAAATLALVGLLAPGLDAQQVPAVEASAQPPPRQAARVDRDLPYARVNGRELKLDLYRPADLAAESRLPLIVWIHGGGWRSGSKDRTPAAFLVEHGYVVASVEYRLTGEAPFPAQIEDCRSALRWLRANAETYQIDPGKIGVWGSSAGGHLVALLGTTGDEQRWDRGDHLDATSRVQAVCDYFGPSNLGTMGGFHDRADSPESLLIGGPILEHPDRARDASPITYVSADDPPFLIVHGMQDNTVPPSQSQELHEALRKAGVASELVLVEDAGHGFSRDSRPPIQEIQQQVRAFFDRQLK